MTGGLTNPFSLLMTVPVVVSATSLPLRHDRAARRAGDRDGHAARLLPPAAALVRGHDARHALHLRGRHVDGGVLIDRVHRASTPSASPRRRACWPTRLRRPNWCCSASSISPRSTGSRPRPRTNSARRSPPSRWSPRRWNGRSGDDHATREDVTLLRSQSERCREILKRLTSLSSESEEHLARLPLTSLVEEVIGAASRLRHLDPARAGRAHGPEPVGRRNPGVIYGLGNLVENAVDFATRTGHRRLALERGRGGLHDRRRRAGLSAGDHRPDRRALHVDPPGRRSAAAAWGSACSSPRRCWSARARTLSFRNSNDAGRRRAWCEIAWPRSVVPGASAAHWQHARRGMITRISWTMPAQLQPYIAGP